MPLTVEQGQQIVASIRTVYASCLAKAQQNIDDLRAGIGWRAALLAITGGQEYLREQELQKQLDVVVEIGRQVDQLESRIFDASLDGAMGDRWIAAAQDWEARMRDLDGWIRSPTVKEILAQTLKDIPKAIPQIIPWWVYAGAAAALAFAIWWRRT